MSDSVHCDGCGREGRRRRGTFAPEDWSYREIHHVDESAHFDSTIVYACSEACRNVGWCAGPGRLDSGSDEARRDRIHDMINEMGRDGSYLYYKNQVVKMAVDRVAAFEPERRVLWHALAVLGMMYEDAMLKLVAAMSLARPAPMVVKTALAQEKRDG